MKPVPRLKRRFASFRELLGTTRPGVPVLLRLHFTIDQKQTLIESEP
jgi:hypothetical protein